MRKFSDLKGERPNMKLISDALKPPPDYNSELLIRILQSHSEYYIGQRNEDKLE